MCLSLYLLFILINAMAIFQGLQVKNNVEENANWMLSCTRPAKKKNIDRVPRISTNESWSRNRTVCQDIPDGAYPGPIRPNAGTGIS
ncbi:hypothetical protein F4819DRAFT_85815 [Hypoxylon fuscum]|nr:hypothetical protein F4819DRAFT_85815 [Hypoxylon fuscum]